MALNNDAVLIVNSGNYFYAPAGTALPSNLRAPGNAWTNVGHTSLEDILALSSDGGEATVIGTLQNKSLRTTYSTRTETLSFTLQQFDRPALRLFYGANAVELENGLLAPNVNPLPTKAAFLAVFVDGDHVFAFYAPLAEIYRGDDLEISDTESIASLPVAVKPMVYGTNAYTYAVTPLGEVAKGATAGDPGVYTPLNSVAPLTLSDLNSVTATPSTRWSAGQYITLADGSHAYWDGSSWKAGEAA